MSRLLSFAAGFALCAILLLSSLVVFAQGDNLLANLRPLVIDINQSVPLTATVDLMINDQSMTATVPLTVGVALQVHINGIDNVIVTPKLSPTVAVSTTASTPKKSLQLGDNPSVSDICDNEDTLTDIQQEDLGASMVDKQVIGWTGEVGNVSSDDESYRVQVTVTEDTSGNTHQVYIKGVSRNIASNLEIDQAITFDGTIEEIGMFAGSFCSPIHITDATIGVTP